MIIGNSPNCTDLFIGQSQLCDIMDDLDYMFDILCTSCFNLRFDFASVEISSNKEFIYNLISIPTSKLFMLSYDEIEDGFYSVISKLNSICSANLSIKSIISRDFRVINPSFSFKLAGVAFLTMENDYLFSFVPYPDGILCLVSSGKSIKMFEQLEFWKDFYNDPISIDNFALRSLFRLPLYEDNSSFLPINHFFIDYANGAYRILGHLKVKLITKLNYFLLIQHIFKLTNGLVRFIDSSFDDTYNIYRFYVKTDICSFKTSVIITRIYTRRFLAGITYELVSSNNISDYEKNFVSLYDRWYSNQKQISCYNVRRERK